MESLPLALQQPDPEVRIRPVRMSDTRWLHNHCWPDRPFIAIYHLIDRARYFARQGRGLGLAVVMEDDTAIGYGQVTLWPRCAEISDLVVAESCRGQGIGTTLIQHLTQAARDMHAPCVEIGAALSNTGAVELYRRLGFQDSNTVMLNLGQGREAVLYLRLRLG
jgi:ribosomal protein S18 acetylase RimI-like enzyme